MVRVRNSVKSRRFGRGERVLGGWEWCWRSEGGHVGQGGGRDLKGKEVEKGDNGSWWCRSSEDDLIKWSSLMGHPQMKKVRSVQIWMGGDWRHSLAIQIAPNVGGMQLSPVQ